MNLHKTKVTFRSKWSDGKPVNGPDGKPETSTYEFERFEIIDSEITVSASVLDELAKMDLSATDCFNRGFALAQGLFHKEKQELAAGKPAERQKPAPKTGLTADQRTQLTAILQNPGITPEMAAAIKATLGL